MFVILCCFPWNKTVTLFLFPESVKKEGRTRWRMPWTTFSLLLHTCTHLPSSPHPVARSLASVYCFNEWLCLLASVEVSQWQLTAGGQKTWGECWWRVFPCLSLCWWPTCWLRPQTTGQSSDQVAASIEFPLQIPVNIHFCSQSQFSVDSSLNPKPTLSKSSFIKFSLNGPGCVCHGPLWGTPDWYSEHSKF